ncbi:hypothetical protein ACQKE0_01530 [Shewanella colwelliana]|uniref:hypothetical protein n=1 Tax=Shewanella colwelliana TaxID=23 RepID=UPI003CFC5D5C
MVLKLTLSDPWADQHSPLTLRFHFYGLRLRFDEPWVANDSPISLRFGDDGGPIDPPIDDNSIGIELGLAWLSLDAIEQLTALSNHNRAIEQATEVKWHSGGAIDSAISLINQSGALAQIHLLSLWESSHSIKQQFNLAWALPELLTHHTQFTWLNDVGLQQCSQLAWKTTPAIARELTLGYAGHDVAQQISVSYRYHLSVGDEKGIAWGPHQPRWICSTKYRPPEAGVITLRFSEPWANSESPLALRFEPSPNYCYFDDGGGLIDGNPSLPNLDFKIPIEPQIRRAYLMQPTLSCTRVSDGLAIVLGSVSISDSRGQYAHGVDIEFSSAIDASRAENELLLIDINGYQFYALPEQPVKRLAFGSASYSSSGRSRVAQLAQPWRLPISYTNNTARSFAAICGDMVQNTGWSVALVGVTDFNVPAGAFSTMGKSPIESVSDAAAQIGCMINLDEFNSKINIVPRWPTSPWTMDSATPDINIHDAVILSYSCQKEISRLCNVAWVRGEQHGVSANVKRTGSAGDIATDDISAQLIVDNIAARLAGSNALADTGNKELITVTLPVMADLPPLKKGMLVGVTYRTEVFKATCHSVSIRASMDQQSGLDVEQTVNLIRHLE